MYTASNIFHTILILAYQLSSYSPLYTSSLENNKSTRVGQYRQRILFCFCILNLKIDVILLPYTTDTISFHNTSKMTTNAYYYILE